jgi:hypothetical protein
VKAVAVSLAVLRYTHRFGAPLYAQGNQNGADNEVNVLTSQDLPRSYPGLEKRTGWLALQISARRPTSQGIASHNAPF